MPSSLSAPPSQGITAENSNQKRSNILGSEHSRRMGVLFEINRDFPFQIPLPFDDAGMEVLESL
jgi:hypothetical protein